MAEGCFQVDDQCDLRDRMISEQLRARGVYNSKVLDAMRVIPRHEFVPVAQRLHAYEDRPLSIGSGQTISQPYMVAVMTEILHPAEDDLVLEVGTGSGYQAAILSKLVREVISIESCPDLAERARRTLNRLNISNVTIIEGDGGEGFLERQPYNGIIVTAAAPNVPESLGFQLIDGGCLVIPVGGQSSQQLFVVTRTGDKFHRDLHGNCVFVPLRGKYGWS